MAAQQAELRCTVFVGNVAVFCSEMDLANHFVACGEIVEVRLAKSEDLTKHLSYGFIRYANVAGAQLALQTLNGSMLCGRPLKVDKAQSRSDRNLAKTVEKSSMPTMFNSASVHVTFISHQTKKIINEETLRYLFIRFGNIQDVIITKHTVDEQGCKQSGYGFVHFPLNPEGIDSAVRMSESISDMMIDEVNYKCKLSHDLEIRLGVSQPSSKAPSPVPPPLFIPPNRNYNMPPMPGGSVQSSPMYAQEGMNLSSSSSSSVAERVGGSVSHPVPIVIPSLSIDQFEHHPSFSSSGSMSVLHSPVTLHSHTLSQRNFQPPPISPYSTRKTTPPRAHPSNTLKALLAPSYDSLQPPQDGFRRFGISDNSITPRYPPNTSSSVSSANNSVTSMNSLGSMGLNNVHNSTMAGAQSFEDNFFNTNTNYNNTSPFPAPELTRAQLALLQPSSTTSLGQSTHSAHPLSGSYYDELQTGFGALNLSNPHASNSSLGYHLTGQNKIRNMSDPSQFHTSSLYAHPSENKANQDYRGLYQNRSYPSSMVDFPQYPAQHFHSNAITQQAVNYNPVASNNTLVNNFAYMYGPTLSSASNPSYPQQSQNSNNPDMRTTYGYPTFHPPSSPK